MLDADPATEANVPNKKSREVKSGHYVIVKPDPLPDPELLIHSPSLAAELGLTKADVETPGFAAFFSGQVDAIPGFLSWCTPYALSIYGQEMYQQCPFQNGNGYGDGRAISVAEVISPTTGGRWELQLKGAGKTPFCRGADGRAVLRSSIREFLASEAMHHMDVSTTRALSLIQSGSEVVMRPWYSDKRAGAAADEPDIHDPRLAGIPMAMRKMFLAQLSAQMKQESSQPDVMLENAAAITTRAAKSFLRVGHVELMGRRARKHASDAVAQSQLELIVKHLIFREYPDIRPGAAAAGGSGGGGSSTADGVATAASSDLYSSPLTSTEVLAVLRRVSAGIATLTADWIRVGFVQGNFNSDNCLAAGRTMDYGPFGFMEEYKPLWNMWQGSGDHFGFLNQPTAGAKNFESFATAVLPLLKGDAAATAAAKELVVDHADAAEAAVDDVWRRKLGFAQYGKQEMAIREALEALMQSSKLDYTIFWRKLAAAAGSPGGGAALLAVLEPAWYSALHTELEAGWVKWLDTWKAQLQADGNDSADVAAAMRKTSPKYVPREWMLVEAYTAAYSGDLSLVHELHELFMNPFDEQPEHEEKYYRKAPLAACKRGGTGFMS